MNRNNDLKAWSSDFFEFLNENNSSVPADLSLRISEGIERKLKPSPLKVFLMLTGIHAVAGTATLLFCPQFGISLGFDIGLMQALMPFGMSACMTVCGALFLGISFLVSVLILSPEDIRTLRRNRSLQALTLAVSSCLLLLFFGDRNLQAFVLPWLLGSLVGALLFLELGWALRISIKRGRFHVL